MHPVKRDWDLKLMLYDAAERSRTSARRAGGGELQIFLELSGRVDLRWRKWNRTGLEVRWFSPGASF